MPRYFAALWAWFREQFDPTLPPAALRPRVDDATPPPTARFVFVKCPTCRLSVAVGVTHECLPRLWQDDGHPIA